MKSSSMPSLKAPASRLGSPKLALIFATAVTGLLSGPQALAQTKVWKTGGNGNWFNGGNWVGNISPVAGDTLSLGDAVTANTVNNMVVDQLVGGILFTNSNLTVTNAFTATGNRITLGGDITTTASTTAIADSLSFAMILNGNRTASIGAGHNMTLSGVLSETGGSFGISKTEAGILTLSGAESNTYTGLTTVSAGTLELNKSGANITAIANGGLTINTGGTVQYNAAASAFQIGNQSVVTVAGGTFDMNNVKDVVGKLIYNSGTISNISGPLQLAAAGPDNLSMRDTTIGFDVDILSNGTGSLGPIGVTFDATNNGTATINGDINININAASGSTRTFTINNGTAATDMIINGVIKNTVSGGLIKAGAGTLALTNNNTYGGATAVNFGTLLLNNTTGSGTGGGAVTVASGAALGGNGTVGGSATFNDSSIFAWNLSVTTPANTGSATVADTFSVTGDLTDGGATGGSVFKILLAGNQTFADNFWTANQNWSSVLTSGNLVPVALETLFTSFSYENVDGTISPTGYGSFTLSGSTLSWQAVPEPSTALAGLLLTAGLLRRRRL